MRDSKYLLPDNQETIKATEILANDGFVVMPYMYPDLNVARDLVNAGAATIMPLASPIGSNKGLATKDFIQILIDEIDLPIIVDAGVGKPSQACEAMEMGAARLLLRRVICRLWHRHSDRQLKQDEKHICRGLEECFHAEHPHQILLPDFCVIKGAV